MKYSENTLIALILNELIYLNEYEKEELYGIRKFLSKIVKEKTIKEIAETLGVDVEVEDE